MVAAGLGDDLLLGNEVLDAARLGALVAAGARITLAVDSEQTIEAATAGGVREVLIDVNVGLPRCGCDPRDAGRLADLARQRGSRFAASWAMGHVVGLVDAAERAERCRASMELPIRAHSDVGGGVVWPAARARMRSTPGRTEIQAGSYALMDTAYGRLGLPFEQAAFVLASVISSSPGWAVGDAGLKAFGMDHGNPALMEGTVQFCSDEHVTFVPPRPVGDKAWLVPAHIDPTMALP